jgi:hypothetical protein
MDWKDFLIESQINTGFSLLFALLKKPKMQRDKFKSAFIKLRDLLNAAYPPEND